MSLRVRVLAIALAGCAGGTATGPGDATAPREDAPVVPDDAVVDAGVVDAAIDGPPPAIVRIEEVYVDQSAGGAGTEYIEISGTPGGSLDGLSVRVIGSAGTSGVKHTYALSSTSGATMPSDGRWVIGGALVTASDRTLTTTSSGDDWNLDGTAGAIQLLRASASIQLVDVLGYGATVSPAMSLSAPTTTVEGTHEALPPSTRSLGRLAGSADGDNNMTDFCGQTATPGAANGACL